MKFGLSKDIYNKRNNKNSLILMTFKNAKTRENIIIGSSNMGFKTDDKNS